MGEKYKKGLRLLRKGKLEKAKTYFTSKLGEDNYLVYYGLATAIFKEDFGTNSQTDIEKIIELYLKSVAKKVDFADAYYMLGFAYIRLISIMIIEYKISFEESKINKMIELLKKSKECFEKSVELEPGFEDNLQSELDSYNERLEKIENLRIMMK